METREESVEEKIASQVFGMYENLNLAFQLNYTQSCMLKQVSESSGFSAKLSEDKLDMFNKVRIGLFSDIEKNIEQFDNALFHDNFFEDTQNQILDLVRVIYGKQLKFGDFMDKFHLKFEPFIKEREKLYRELSAYKPSNKIALLQYGFEMYFEMLQYKSCIETCRKIFEMLKNNYTDNGYKSIYYDKIMDKDVVEVNKEFIEKLAKLADNLKKETEKIYERENKKYLRGKLNIEGNVEYYITEKLDQKNIAENLFFFSSVLKSRLKAQTSSCFNTKLKIEEKLYDFLGGIPMIKDIKPNSRTYSTELEMDFIKFLLEKLRGTGEFYKTYFADGSKLSNE